MYLEHRSYASRARVRPKIPQGPHELELRHSGGLAATSRPGTRERSCAPSAGQIEGNKAMMLLDVTSLTLGVETQGGHIAPLIPRNTTVPTTRAEIFTTALDGQDSVEVHVTQGERPLARDNQSLARFHLDGIPAAPRSVPQIEVSFALDANR